MIIQLFEELLQEVNYEKTRDTFMKAFAKRAMEDNTCRFEVVGFGKCTAKDFLMLGGKDEGEIERYRRELFDHLFPLIQKYDPTHERTTKPDVYVIWMIIRYIKGGIKLWEDMETMTSLLAAYDELKKYDVFKKMHRAGVIDDEELTQYNDISKIAGKSELFTITQEANRWKNKNDTDAAETTYRRYTDWAFKGGCKILYPREGTSEQRRALFAKYGMVLRLDTLECSVDLFQGPTAWCTARPENDYFDQYSLDAPLIVIVDNFNEKFYQFHEPTEQYLDEKDDSNYAALSIPLPLLQVALKAADTNLASVMRRTDDRVSNKLITNMSAAMAGASPLTSGPNAVWQKMISKPTSYEPFDLPYVIDWYVNEVGTLPKLYDINEYARALEFDDSGDTVDEIDPEYMNGLLMTILRNPNAKATPEMVDTLFESTKITFKSAPLLIHYFYNTPKWNEARSLAMQEITAGKIDYSNMFTSSYTRSIRSRATVTLCDAIRSGVPTALESRLPQIDVFEAMRLSREEIGAICSSGLEYIDGSPSTLPASYLTAFLRQENPKLLPDTTSFVQMFDRSRISIAWMIMKFITNQPKTRAILGPHINYNRLLAAEVTADGVPTGNAHAMSEIILHHDEYQQNFNDDTLRLMLSGHVASEKWTVIRNSLPENPVLAQVFENHPEYYRLVKDLLIASMTKYGYEWGKPSMFFFYDELSAHLTVPDLSAIWSVCLRSDLRADVGVNSAQFLLDVALQAQQDGKLRIPKPIVMKYIYYIWERIVEKRGWSDWMTHYIERFNLKLPAKFVEALYGKVHPSIFIDLCQQAGLRLPPEYIEAVKAGQPDPEENPLWTQEFRDQGIGTPEAIK